MLTLATHRKNRTRTRSCAHVSVSASMYERVCEKLVQHKPNPKVRIILSRLMARHQWVLHDRVNCHEKEKHTDMHDDIPSGSRKLTMTGKLRTPIFL